MNRSDRAHASDPAWLDTQYNARAANPDHESTFARWAEASQQARARLPCRLGMRYGDGALQTADWFEGPDHDGPVLVFIHGGYWRSSDMSLYSFLAPPFVEAGASVVALNYDLCPSVSIEHIAVQMTQAVHWVHRECGKRGGNAGMSRIVAAGHSAGGHLAAMLLACDWTRVGTGLPPRRVSRALGISGIYELEPLRHAPFIAGDLRLTPESVERVSPARYPPPDGATMYAVVGALESEQFIAQTRRIARRWGKRVVPVCEAIAQRRHFDILDDLAEPGSRLHAMARSLLGLRRA